MAINTRKILKKEPTPKPRRNTWSLFSFLENYLRLDGIFEHGLPVRYIPHILFVTALGIVYIGNIHYAEKNIRLQEKLKHEVDEMRSEYTTLKAEYMYDSKQSAVADRVDSLGLYESSVPPYKVKMRTEEEE
jgi:hypothetical protein